MVLTNQCVREVLRSICQQYVAVTFPTQSFDEQARYLTRLILTRRTGLIEWLFLLNVQNGLFPEDYPSRFVVSACLALAVGRVVARSGVYQFPFRVLIEFNWIWWPREDDMIVCDERGL